MSDSAIKISDFLGLTITESDNIPEKDLTLKELVPNGGFPHQVRYATNQDALLHQIKDKFNDSPTHTLIVINNKNHPLGTIRFQSLSKILENAPTDGEIENTCKKRNQCKIFNMSAGEAYLEDCIVGMDSRVSEIAKKMRDEKVAAVGVINKDKELTGVFFRSALAHKLIHQSEKNIVEDVSQKLSENNDEYVGFIRGVEMISDLAKEISGFLGTSLKAAPGSVPENNLTLQELVPDSKFPFPENFTIKSNYILKDFSTIFEKPPIDMLFVVGENNQPLGIIRYQSLNRILSEAPTTTIESKCKDQCSILNLSAGEVALEKPEEYTAKMNDTALAIIDKMKKNKVAALGVVNENNQLIGLLHRSRLAHVLIDRGRTRILKNMDQSIISYNIKTWVDCHPKPYKKKYPFDGSLASPKEILNKTKVKQVITNDTLGRLSWLLEL